jgi:hypothetical protein
VICKSSLTSGRYQPVWPPLKFFEADVNTNRSEEGIVVDYE